MSSSTKEYAVSEHSGFFVQPLIAQKLNPLKEISVIYTPLKLVMVVSVTSP